MKKLILSILLFLWVQTIFASDFNNDELQKLTAKRIKNSSVNITNFKITDSFDLSNGIFNSIDSGINYISMDKIKHMRFYPIEVEIDNAKYECTLEVVRNRSDQKGGEVGISDCKNHTSDTSAYSRDFLLKRKYTHFDDIEANKNNPELIGDSEINKSGKKFQSTTKTNEAIPE